MTSSDLPGGGGAVAQAGCQHHPETVRNPDRETKRATYGKA